METKRVELLKKLEIVNPARSSSVATPVLTHFMFKKGQVITTDGEVTIGASLKGLALDRAVPGHLLDLVRTFQPPKKKKGGKVPPDVLSFELSEKELHIKTPISSKIDLKLHVLEVLPGLDVPKIASDKAKACPKELVDAVRRCMRSVGKEGGHLAELSGITIDGATVYATDAKTISREYVPEAKGLTSGRHILPLTFCKLMCSLYDSPNNSKIEFEKKRVVLHTEKAVIIGNYIATDNPFNFEKSIETFFPSASAKKVVQIPTGISAALDRAVILTQNTVDQNRTKIAVKNGLLSLESLSDRGEGNDKLVIKDHANASAVIDASLFRAALGDFMPKGDMLLTGKCLVLKRNDSLYMISTQAE
jgi:hypothetical protein